LNSIMVFIYYGDVILNDAIWNKNKWKWYIQQKFKF
jgi:hypothetical protein